MWWYKPDSPNFSHLSTHNTWVLLLFFPSFKSTEQHKYITPIPPLGRLMILNFLSSSMRLFSWNMRCEQKELLKRLGSAPAHWIRELLWTLMALFAWIKGAGIPHGFLIYFQQMETWCYMTRRKWKKRWLECGSSPVIFVRSWKTLNSHRNIFVYWQMPPNQKLFQILTTLLQLFRISKSWSTFRHSHIFVPFGFQLLLLHRTQQLNHLSRNSNFSKKKKKNSVRNKKGLFLFQRNPGRQLCSWQ